MGENEETKVNKLCRQSNGIGNYALPNLLYNFSKRSLALPCIQIRSCCPAQYKNVSVLSLWNRDVGFSERGEDHRLLVGGRAEAGDGDGWLRWMRVRGRSGRI